VILAGGGAGSTLAHAGGVENKALLQYRGRTLLDIAITAMRESGVIDDVLVVGDLPVPPGVGNVPDRGSFIANLLNGLDAIGLAENAIVSTSDMPFLSPATVAGFARSAARLDADLVYPIVAVEPCARAFPEMRRTSLPVREGRFTGGNMVLARPCSLISHRADIERAYASRKSPLRLALMLGPTVTLGVAASVLTGRGFVALTRLERAASRLIGARARALVMDDPAIATDVDRPGDLDALLGRDG
jgi:CTP:molybdopterin cytidylyltransferase MocA